MTAPALAPLVHTDSFVDAVDETTAPAIRSVDTIDALVRETMPLVGHLVRELATRLPSHVNRDDLVSAGMLALATSAQSFEPDRGVPFARFAAIRIRGALTDELRSMDWASRGVRGKARQLDSVRAELTTTLGRTPTRDEIAAAMGVAARDVEAVDADVRRAGVLSLQALACDDAGQDAGYEQLLPHAADGPESLLLKREQLGYLHDAIEELPERLRTIVRGSFFEGRTMTGIAATLGVTESRVSQLRTEALALLRAAMDTAAGNAAAEESTRRRAAAARLAYCTAVMTRSSVGDRLRRTTVLAEPHGASRPDLHLV